MTEVLGPSDLNRTLLARQHLLERSRLTPMEMIGHLVGLQAQAPLPPYLSLAARLEGFDPLAVSSALADRSLVRIYSLRGTVHLLRAEDALQVWPFSRPVHARELRSSQNLTQVRHLGGPGFERAVDAALADGPLPLKALGMALAEAFPQAPPTQLGGLARVTAPLVQVPPRGQWRTPGGVVYQRLDTWVDRPLPEPDVEGLIHRYLRAYGPATGADVTAWSGVTGIARLIRDMPGLVTRRTTEGKLLYDVPDAPLASGETPAPVRLLGDYDNVWLSHAGRDRVTGPETRGRWMGVNGGLASTIFVDGMLAGLWRVVDDVPVVVELFRDLTATEQAGLDEELARMSLLLVCGQ